MAGIAITRTDMSAADLRAAARLSANARQALRILAIAMVLDGFSREEAARLCGMDRQSLRDWVHSDNKEGLDGLADRARSGRPASLSWVEQGKFASWVEEGADLARDGVVRFRRVDLCDRIAAEFGVSLHERSVGKLRSEAGLPPSFRASAAPKICVSAGAIALLVVDGAGRHRSPKLVIPENIIPLKLPPYAPELNPTENIWEYLRGNALSHQVWETYDDVVDACCNAWNTLMRAPDIVPQSLPATGAKRQPQDRSHA